MSIKSGPAFGARGENDQKIGGLRASALFPALNSENGVLEKVAEERDGGKGALIDDVHRTQLYICYEVKARGLHILNV